MSDEKTESPPKAPEIEPKTDQSQEDNAGKSNSWFSSLNYYTSAIAGKVINFYHYCIVQTSSFSHEF